MGQTRGIKDKLNLLDQLSDKIYDNTFEAIQSSDAIDKDFNKFHTLITYYNVLKNMIKEEEAIKTIKHHIAGEILHIMDTTDNDPKLIREFINTNFINNEKNTKPY